MGWTSQVIWILLIDLDNLRSLAYIYIHFTIPCTQSWRHERILFLSKIWWILLRNSARLRGLQCFLWRWFWFRLKTIQLRLRFVRLSRNRYIFSSTLILFFLDSNCLGYEERCREVEGIKECKQVCVAAVGTPLEFEDNSRPSSSDSDSGTYVYQ